MLRFVLKDGGEAILPKSELDRLSLFKKRPELLEKDTYMIQSNVSLDVLDRLMSRCYGVESKEAGTEEEMEQLKALCDELGFSAFQDEVRPAPNAAGSNITKDIVCLKGCTARHDMIMEKLQRQVIELERRLETQNEMIQRMARTEETLQETIQALQNEIQHKDMNGPVRELVNESSDKANSSSNNVSLGTQDNAGMGTMFVYRPAQPLRGIIAHLTRKIDGNVFTYGVVIVYTSSCCRGDGRSLVNLEKPCVFSSKDRPNSWIAYDFMDRRVTPTSYSIRSWSACAASCHPKSWVFEVSTNGETWEIVDRRENNNNLNDTLAIDNFSINPVPNGGFRFIRLRQIGKNHKGNDQLCISSLEVFGTLTEKPRPRARPNEFLFDERNPLDGIIADLKRKCEKYVGYFWDKGIVVKTVGSTNADKPSNWLCYDFRERRITLTGYSFETRESRGSGLVSWFVDVSNDGETWEVVDRRQNGGLYEFPVIRHFDIKYPPKGAFRFIRFHHIRKDPEWKNDVFISSFEVFGVLTEKPRPVPRPGEICFDDCQPLTGIIARLTSRCGRDVHLQGVVEVTSSSRYRSHPMDATRRDPNNCFFSKDETNSWICYDFKGRRVTPTSYSISNGYKQPCLRSWVFEVSNDGEAWEVVDQREDVNNWSSFEIQNFPINPEPSKSCRFVRLRQTGQNDAGNNQLCIDCLEVFGVLTDIPRPVSHPGEFPFYDLRPLGGIIAHLSDQYRNNVHAKGVVEVTASSEAYTKPAIVADGGPNNSEFKTSDKRNSWICYDFKEKRVTPTSYSIGVGEDYQNQLKSWVFEVSNNGKKWQVIDRQESNELIVPLAIRNFPITSEVRESFRFVRIRQTGKNHSGHYKLAIRALEIFGKLCQE